MFIVLFLVSHFNVLFIQYGRLNWLPVSFLLHVKYTLSCRISLQSFKKFILANAHDKKLVIL